MAACDELYFATPIGSPEEESRKTSQTGSATH